MIYFISSVKKISNYKIVKMPTKISISRNVSDFSL